MINIEMNKLVVIFLCTFFFTVASIKAHPGIGIVMDSNGNIFYTDLTHVWKITPDGTRFIAVKNVHTHELYLDGDDNLYGEHEWYNGEATDTWGNYVWCLGHDGSFEKTIPDVEGLLDNHTLIRDTKDNTYWSKRYDNYHLLYKETSNGQQSLVTSHTFENIRWIHYSKGDACLYIVDKLKIKRVSPTGHVTVLVENLKDNTPPFEGVGDHHYVYGLWTDIDHNVYVAVYGARKVKKISPKGVVTTFYTSEAGWSPCGGLVAPNGTQWVLEFSEDNIARVVKIGLDGKASVHVE